MQEWIDANRRLWDAWTPLTLASALYDVEGWKAGRPRRRQGLDAIETALVGDVAGQSFLHLQCHFGLDTLGWARRGAVVTGVDFSPVAIAAARRLAAEVGLPATFLESDVYALPGRLAGQFDVVFTSEGVLGWLPDLARWAAVVAHFLRPGGRFVLVEAHPVAMTLDDRRDDGQLVPRHPYFQGPAPLREVSRGCYAAPDAPIESVEHLWIHPLAEVLGALLGAGLRLGSFAEYPYMGWRFLPWMEERPDGCWQLPGGAPALPLMYSLTATKPEEDPGAGGR